MGLKNYRGRVHDSGVDVLNGVSGMEHLSNSLVRKPLQQFNPGIYSPMNIGVNQAKEYGFKRNEAIRRSANNSREHSRSSGNQNRSQPNPEVVYDPFYTNQQRYLAHQKATSNKQN